MNRIDTLRAISARCRRSHSMALLAVGYVTVDMPTEELEGLLGALDGSTGLDALLTHLERLALLQEERYGRSSRLD